MDRRGADTWGDKPCHGNVFHIQHQCETLANTLSRLAIGTRSGCQNLQARLGRAHLGDPDGELATQSRIALAIETQAYGLARDIRTLTQWLYHDVLALAGPVLAKRQVLFDFIFEELAHREPEDVRRIRPVRIALQNQRDSLVAFAGLLDEKLAASRKTITSPRPSCGKPAFCTGCPPPRPRTGRDGTDFGRGWEMASTRCSMPRVGPWRQHHAGIRWWQT